ncbi:MAG: cation transporter [Anaerolineales bacterium]|nr:cation transporter [Anaerolineales bacterium]
MSSSKSDATHRMALLLSLFTIAANIIEGVVSMALGVQDETLALFGFGVDSFIEVISAAGIAQLILRIWRNPGAPRSRFEVTALRITGTSFYLLAAGLVLGAVVNTVAGRSPESARWGLAISAVSISVMTGLFAAKRAVGKRLESAPILADANCTLVCIYMSVVLLASSALFELTGFGLLDSLGALGLAFFSFREGRESFEKARGKECGCAES